MNFNDFQKSSAKGTSAGPKYPIEKPVSPLVIPTSPNLPLMGDMVNRDQLKKDAGVDLCWTQISPK